MKLGRNDICSCGSGKKHKHCCMDDVSKLHTEMLDDVEQAITMNPNIDINELNLVIQNRSECNNTSAKKEFFGLTPSQMSNWLYAPFSELEHVNICLSESLLTSPVMRYLQLIIDEAVLQGGSFKATSKGNLPAKLVRLATGILSEFEVSQYNTNVSISEFAGSNEDKFNALHYARILADISGIIYLKGGRFYVKKAVLKQYQTQGIKAFFLPMLEAASKKYNWAYFDHFTKNDNLHTFWLFMIWRLQAHSSINQLIEDVAIAFPSLLQELPSDEYFSPEVLLGHIIHSRFINRFLVFFGFVTVPSTQSVNGKRVEPKLNALPLFSQTFKFSV